jgi:phage repressor protein C with HTH and peptisase S24 domain
MKHLTHDQVWRALDLLAQRNNLSASGLAKRAGLDPTAFNKSKRIAPDGHQRWPSTESIAKCLEATNTSVEEFSALLGSRGERPGVVLPLVRLDEAAQPKMFDETGLPGEKGWDELNFPAIQDQQAFAIEVTGDGLMPFYRDGARLVVAPTETVRAGDRVVIMLHDGRLMVRELRRQTARALELRSFAPAAEDESVSVRDVAWMSRIVWASQ